MHGPHLILDKDVVLVSLNYRLGALGFLSLGNQQVSQSGQSAGGPALAMNRWVNELVGKFGNQ